MSFHLKNKVVPFIFLAVLGMLVSACSVKKNTWSRRTFHNITSHYNVYWNGNESLKTGESDLRKKAVDDYDKVLRVYNYGKKADAQGQYPAMDRAIQKSSIGIQRHSMVFGGKEQVKWIDDSYLLMGKAYFYKQDFIAARRTFDFVSHNYSYNDISQLSDLWLARTYIQLEQFEKAQALLNALEAKMASMSMPKEVVANLPLVIADYYIATGKYPQALPYLRQGITSIGDRLLATRLMFISAQINELTGEQSKALGLYNNVIKRNPPYDMAFEARINLATAYDANAGDSKQINKVLKKMLRDDKNKDFRDKIYFALAEVASKDKNDTLAMFYLGKSVQVSVKNNSQKATSALKLASLLFDYSRYVPAQAYYDTAVQVLPTDYPGYDSIKSRALVLGDLVQNLSTLQEQDSLLRLSVLDSTALYAIVDRLIARYEKEEAQKLKDEANREFMVQNAGSTEQKSTSGPQSGEWYFYNPNTLSFGYTEFLRKWGRRKLEDNWRISDKKSISFDEGKSIVAEKDNATPADSAAAAITPRSRNYYLANIPFEETQKSQSYDLIIEALNNLGYIYKDYLKDLERSKESYLSLNDRFPQNDHRLTSWYALYKIYLAQDNTAEAEKYKSLILTSYPDTDYARIILDPNYYARANSIKSESLALYEQTFEAYKTEQYFRVLVNGNKARELYASDSLLMARFDFLRAVAIGKVQVLDSMAAALNELVLKYPNSEVTPLAVEIMRQLSLKYKVSVEIPEAMRNPLLDKEKSPYSFDASAVHMVMVITNSNNVRTDPMKVRISDFNTKYFSLSKLMIKNLMLDNARSLVTVGNFNNAAEAADYYKLITQNDYVFGNTNKNDYEVFPVSVSNYPLFYKDKDVEKYRNFWREQYPKQTNN
ncbi:MAG: hypothetical protein KGZ82_11770 [Bacteroidales bacterium]|nr:hypothetical protein [Bacteroidales bacterium]